LSSTPAENSEGNRRLPGNESINDSNGASVNSLLYVNGALHSDDQIIIV